MLLHCKQIEVTWLHLRKADDHNSNHHYTNECIDKLSDFAFMYLIILIDNFLEYYKNQGKIFKLFKANENILNYRASFPRNYILKSLQIDSDLDNVISHIESYQIKTVFNIDPKDNTDSLYLEIKSKFSTIIGLRDIYAHFYEPGSKSKFKQIQTSSDARTKLYNELDSVMKELSQFFIDMYFYYFGSQYELDNMLKISEDDLNDLLMLYRYGNLDLISLEIFKGDYETRQKFLKSYEDLKISLNASSHTFLFSEEDQNSSI